MVPLSFSSLYCQARSHWRDILIVLALAAVAGFASYQGARLIDPVIIVYGNTRDTWFDADIPYAYYLMHLRGTQPWSDNIHPLFTLTDLPRSFYHLQS